MRRCRVGPHTPRLLIAVVLACASSGALLAQGEQPHLSDLQQAKARIILLEDQLRKAQAEQTVCVARLALASQPQIDADTKAKMAELEKQAGCAIDWQAQPVSCKAAK